MTVTANKQASGTDLKHKKGVRPNPEPTPDLELVEAADPIHVFHMHLPNLSAFHISVSGLYLSESDQACVVMVNSETSTGYSSMLTMSAPIWIPESMLLPGDWTSVHNIAGLCVERSDPAAQPNRVSLSVQHIGSTEWIPVGEIDLNDPKM